MAKNYCTILSPANSPHRYSYFEDTTGSDSADDLSATQKDGLLRNFLNAIFLRPVLLKLYRTIVNYITYFCAFIQVCFQKLLKTKMIIYISENKLPWHYLNPEIQH